MEQRENIRDYYQQTDRELPADLLNSGNETSHFNILKRNRCLACMPFNRRDYYKICLTVGVAVLYTEKGEIEVNRPAIFFSNPNIKWGWKNLSDDQGGYVCLFNEQYISAELKRELNLLYDLFSDMIYPFLFLNNEQYDVFLHYFKLMSTEYREDFAFKNEIIQSTLKLIIYSSIKIHSALHPEVKKIRLNNLSARFMELLNAQFPVDAPQNSVMLKTPADFAAHLHVHINHLNYSVKSETGKSTTKVIKERIMKEAVNLLQYSNWNIAEIGYSLGFEYPQHFNSFFKKEMGQSPRAFRESLF